MVATRIASHTLAVGPDVGLEVAEIGDSSGGPTVAVLGGVHGDEYEGVLSVRRLQRRLEDVILRGRVLAVAVANPPAFAAGTRTSPIDGLNLARVFPGDADGPVTMRLARAITEHVIAPADLLIDLHSGGRKYAMPLFCGYGKRGGASDRAACAALAFGTKLVWVHDRISAGRSLSAAADLGVPAVYAECLGGSQVRGAETDAYVDGVLRVLAGLGVIDDPPAAAPPSVHVIDGGHGNTDEALTAASAGTFVTRCRVGDVVTGGTLVAEIYDAHGRVTGTVEAPQTSTVMMLRRDARVSADDPVVLFAPPPRSMSRATAGSRTAHA